MKIILPNHSHKIGIGFPSWFTLPAAMLPTFLQNLFALRKR